QVLGRREGLCVLTQEPGHHELLAPNRDESRTAKRPRAHIEHLDLLSADTDPALPWRRQHGAAVASTAQKTRELGTRDGAHMHRRQSVDDAADHAQLAMSLGIEPQGSAAQVDA